MRLLVINPNTTESVTELVADLGRRLAEPGSEIRAVTGRFGARYISSRSAAAIASHAALELLATHVEGCDAVYLACFGDPGLFALKELSPVPVIGMAEASCHLAATVGRRFSIVTGGARWSPMLEEFVTAIGLSASLASVRTVAPTGAEIAAAPDRALASLSGQARACAEEDGAEVVILGGAALAGLASRIDEDVPVPVLCSVEVGFRAAFAAARLRPRKARAGSLSAPQPVETIGLGEALESAMHGRPM
ncbi:aspartate/glutamate racemase family protein [Microvirga massiliensis]|uniref:aspartate/glutamate racemase family protein n=1 Tax=Microvirga massiliensis TaxID=1033741 RepID=UPI00062BCD84|nr:aspartate/glutamate racemase family protein [Microvirga massiliensis]